MTDTEYRPAKNRTIPIGIAATVLIVATIGLFMANRPGAVRLSKASVEELQVEASRRPNDGDVGLYYAHALNETGDSQRAYEVMKKVVAKHPESTLYKTRLAEYAAINGHATETVGLYHRILEMDPRNADAHSELGHIYSEAGLLTDATQEYDTALKLDPKVWYDPAIYATDLAHVGRDEDAWNQLTFYFNRQPHMDEPYDTLTDVGIRLKRYDETERLLLRRIRLDHEYNVNRFQYDVARVIMARPHGPNTLQDAAVFADAGAYSRMGKWWLIPDEPTPNEARWFALYADILHQLGRDAEARTTLTDGLYLDPFNPECLRQLAELSAAHKDPKAAFWRKMVYVATHANGEVAALDGAITAHPSDPKPLLAKAAYLDRKSTR